MVKANKLTIEMKHVTKDREGGGVKQGGKNTRENDDVSGVIW